MRLKEWFMRESIEMIKEAIDEQPPYISKDIYLRKGDQLIGLHTYGDEFEGKFQQMEAWANSYTLDYKFEGSIFRIFGPIEEEKTAFLEEGWMVVPPPFKKD